MLAFMSDVVAAYKFSVEVVEVAIRYHWIRYAPHSSMKQPNVVDNC